MLFNSYEFIFLFFPLTILGFYGLGKFGLRKLALAWLVATSFYFYGSWNFAYVGLLCFSIFCNHTMGAILSGELDLGINRQWLLRIGLLFNLGLLGYYKYHNFFLGSLNDLLGTDFPLKQILPPLAISFFTFQQIAYLIDTYRGKIKEATFLNYFLFISFFPQLIAGPIVYYQEIMPQFEQKSTFRFKAENLGVGLNIFFIGLFKKVVFADTIAVYATAVFNAAIVGKPLTMVEAWVGAVAFALQLYFDFSGYTDMAIGAARTLGITLPLNFDSPYKAVRISQLWRAWHMTLTRFMREYVFFSVSRWLRSLTSKVAGVDSKTLNVITTVSTIIVMLLIGLWHGAGWNYVIWGILNGVYLVTYQQWREWRRKQDHNLRASTWWGDSLGWLLTFGSWTIALVWAKADSVAEALTMWRGMFGLNGWSQAIEGKSGWETWVPNTQIALIPAVCLILVLLLIVVGTPNTQQWMEHYQPALDHYVMKKTKNFYQRFWQRCQWQMNSSWAIIGAVVAIVAIAFTAREQAFIYFKF